MMERLRKWAEALIARHYWYTVTLYRRSEEAQRPSSRFLWVALADILYFYSQGLSAALRAILTRKG